MRKQLARAAAAAVIAALSASPALAHVTVQPPEAPVGAFFRFVVRVPNERPDSSTVKVEVQFPETLTFVSFQDVPGWERNVKMKTLDEPIEVFGEEITEVVGSVTWTGGEIEPGEFAEFPFSARVPEDETPLEFPALQTYDGGEVVRWIGPSDSDEPAGVVQPVDLGLEEGQGELQALAELKEGSSGEDGGEEEEEDEGSDTGLVLGGFGAVLGALALAVALFKKR
jgi:uncharacterized protein YcnI